MLQSWKNSIYCQHFESDFACFIDGYTTETLEFRWNEEPIQLMDHLEIPQFHLGEMETNQCDKVYVGGNG